MSQTELEKLALKFASVKNLLAIDMGSAHNKPDGYLGVDQYDEEGVDIVCNVGTGLPLDDNSVGVIRAVDFIEHVKDGVALFNEFYRVLAPGGYLITRTPSTDGRGAFQDPTHVAFYNENSFWYYTNPFYRKFVPEITCDFTAVNLYTYFPSEWHEAHKIPYVAADLVANKNTD
jgi:predicted SAM-dependent methyltransferase